MKIERIIKVPVRPINDVLAEHLPGGQKIDFMSIDVEGFEMRILKSLDFGKFGPDYILVEDLKFEGLNFSPANVRRLMESEQNQFLESKGHVALGKTAQTLLYRKNPQ